MSLRRIEDKLEQVSDCLIRMEVNVDRNTDDLAEHIKRTNLIESKMQKIIYLLILGAGIGMALYGPEALKIIGIIL